MDQSTRRYSVVGDYKVVKQIGIGSFSTVWQARHRVHGTEVAIKEISTARLDARLHERLKSEIIFLKRISHPNIIRLHDMIEESGKIYIVLEYCKGGDLSMYLRQRQGKIPEATAKHFMQQLAEGLKVLRDNNLIHRDLKPQNLLLSTNGDNSILKIADFGLARYLQPTGLAETLCGSPLYMAPEVMQQKKYDAKADLWSVGVILFQLVTGKTPFTGRSQFELLQNILKSTELQFPPEAKELSPQYMDLCKKLLRPPAVERLTFDEFFDHPYLSQRQPDAIRSRQSQRVLDGFPLSERNTEENSQEDCLPFSLDDDLRSLDGSPSIPRGSGMKSMYGFSLDPKPDRKDISILANRTASSTYNGAPRQTEITGCRILSPVNLKESLKTTDFGLLNNHSEVIDSLESIDQDYVFVSGPLMDLASSACASKPSHFPSKPGSPPLYTGNMNTTPSAPVPIIGGATGRVNYSESLEKQMSAPGISQGSMDIADISEHPSSDCMTRISSLQHYAAAVTGLVNEKLEGGKQLEAFSIQLVILAIWKQALHICHTNAASAIEGSPSHETRRFRDKVHSPDVQESLGIPNVQGLRDICLQIERAFLREVEHAEELAKAIEPGNLEMPDAMELIYQSAIDLGKRGAVDEYLGEVESAAVYYSKAVRLLQFLLVEAPCLIMNPPFSLTSSDRYRIKNYIDVLNNRQSFSRSQRMALFKG
ncbi:Serine/threonine protein kinase [Handroanthus impetiginosus]|uniref:Serine/threonine protein kinase n=1 Tax=Handroanthus impetiginosus TaxID=429701 RepID=A0A2G9H2C6_9LAMI|nr:Serine/threonine protein kinase [Handroanthus impetiginosus]